MRSHVLLLAVLPSCVSCAVSDDLFVAIVVSRLDYGNATLAGLRANLLNRLQSVLNASARSIADLRRSAHITDNLASFHWLRAPQRIKFKLAVIDYRALHGSAPRYLSDTLSRVADISSQSRLCSSTSSQLMVARHVLSLSGSSRSPQPV